MTKDKKPFNIRDHCPFADSYMEKLAFEGALPECKYSKNSLPETKTENYRVTMDDLFDIGGKDKA